MKTVDEIIAYLAEARRTPAPEYIFDETGIAATAIQRRNLKRDQEWWMEFDDENPY